MLLLEACSKTGSDRVDPAETAGGLREFSATLEQTKTSFNGGKLSWLPTDEIAISDGVSTSIFSIASIEGDVATFVLKEGQSELGSSATAYTAWYPATLRDGLATIRTDSPGEELSQLPMGAVSKNAKLSFTNLCALIKFSISSNSEGVGLKSVKVTADKPLSGPFSIDKGAAVMDGESASAMGIECSAEGGFPLGQTPVELYVPVPAGDYNTFIIEAVASNGVKKVFPAKAEEISLQRNTIYTKTVVLNDLDVNDFREEGAANCYIASHAGKYRFAAVRGDGSTIGSISSVQVLWRYNNTAAGPDDGTIVTSVSYSDGLVDFKADENEGSALIGALDDGGNILWSWHIWRTDEVPSDIIYPDAVMMDRYLGALSSTPGDVRCVGFMYQYGRKDPFPGRIAASNALGKFQGLAYDEQPGPVDIGTAISNPNIRYYGTDSNFWTTAESRSEAEWGGDAKSVQDPCPAGYRIPSNSILGTTAKADIQKMFAWDSSNTGFAFKGDAAWYPTTGQLAPKGKNLNSGTLISFSWSRNTNANGNPLFLDLRNSAINGWSGGAAAAGFAVRCEKYVN